MKIVFTISGTKYIADLDGTCFTLSRIGVNQDKKSANFGQETQAFIGYFTMIKNAVQRAVKDSLGAEPDEISLKEFVERYEKCTEEVNRQIGEK